MRLRDELVVLRHQIEVEEIPFYWAVRRAIGLGVISEKELGARFSASKPTIRRWVQGINEPEAHSKKPVLGLLLEAIEKAVKKARG